MLNDAERQSLNGLLNKPELGESLEIASRTNPDDAAKSNLTPINAKFYNDNAPEIERRKLLSENDPEKLKKSHPKTATWLTDPKNSSVSIDDLSILKGVDDTISSYNRSWGGLAADTSIDLSSGVMSFGQGVVGIADILTFNAVGTILGYVGYDPIRANSIASDYYTNQRKRANLNVQKADGFLNTLGALAENPSAAFGTTVQSLPMMLGGVAAVKGLATKLLSNAGIKAGTVEASKFMSRPDVIAKLTLASAASEGALTAGSIQESARIEGRTWGQSVLPALTAGATTALVSKFSSKLLPDVEVGLAKAMSGGAAKPEITQAFKETVKGSFKEGFFEELPQSAQEQVFTNIALGKQWNEGVGSAAATGLVAGTGMGFGMASSTQAISLMTSVERDVNKVIKSTNEQEVLDQVISYAQTSKTNKRAAGQFEDFIKTVGDRDVLVPVDVAMEMEDAPLYMAEQVNDIGVDIAIPMSKFLTEIVPNKGWMDLLRPHIKLSEGTESKAELEAGERGEIQTILNKAVKEKETITESEKIYQDVKDQIVATGMQSDQTASQSAALYPAAVSAYVEKARLMGKEVSPKDIYDMMGFVTERGDPSADAILNQPAYKNAPYLFDKAKDQFLNVLDEDATAEDVMDAVSGFDPSYKNFINALAADDWLGFDYPSQAISAALSDQIENYDVSKRLKISIGKMVNSGFEYNQPNIPKAQETERRANPGDKSRERRKESKARKMYEDMSREELLNQILKHELTGIKGRRSFVVDVQDAPVVGSIDADSLKWINDNLSPDHGDALLQAVADAIESQTDSAYHISGDEFYVLGETQAEIETILTEVDNILSQAIITATKPDGKVITLTGLNVTYGIGETKDVADQKLKAQKIAREKSGERTGRGEQPFSAVVRDAQGNEIKGYSPDLNQNKIFGQPDNKVNDLNSIKSYFDANNIEHQISESNGVITLSKIVINESDRNKGNGTEAINRLVEYADQSGQIIAITPSKDFGATSIKRLKEFYKRAGFVNNKGKNKNFEISESMIRNPVSGNKGTFDPSNPNILFQGKDPSILFNGDGDQVSSEDIAYVMNEDRWLDVGLKIGKKTKIYRGSSKGDAFTPNTESGMSTQGNGLYTTTDKSQAKEYGEVLELDHFVLPKKPIRFTDELNFQNWLQITRERFGFKRTSEFEKANGGAIDVWVRKIDPDIDGIQIGTGKGAYFVKFPETYDQPNRASTEFTKLKDEGDVGLIETGKPVSFWYTHNTESATSIFGKPKKGDAYGRDYEPSARFISITSEKRANEADGQYIGGKLEFINPLVVPNDNLKWKKKLSEKYGGKTGKRLSKALISDGYDGIITTEEKHISETIDLTSFEESKALYQPTRASIEFTDKNESIIRLTQASDLSSFLHESGHLFLEMERRFANKFGETKEQKVLLDWLGVKSFEDLTTKEHEQFAETFEVYLREGKAPSLKLRDAFASFARWLTSIYRSLTDPRLGNAKLTPEIREYMDRMLATEAEIEQAMANPAYDQFFKSKEQAGMTDAEWEKYQAQVNKAKNTATIDLNQKVIDELKRRKTKDWKEEREPLIDEEIERLSELPVYKVQEAIKEIPLNRKLVKEAMGIKTPTAEERLKSGKKTSGIEKLINKITTPKGENPDAVAELYGYDSVVEMIEDIDSAKPVKKAAFDAAEARMIEKYGDMLNDGRIELEARESIHNDEQAKVVLQEIRALGRKKSPIDREYLKAEAKKLIGSMKYKEIKPNKFYHAEIRAAKKAVTATDDQEILTAKTQQIANHYLYREAVNRRDAMNQHRKQVKGFETREYNPKTVAQPYPQNIRMLAKSYNMRQGDARKNLDVEQVVNWMITQMNDPNNYIDLSIFDPNIIKMIVDRQDGKPVDYSLPEFDDLTADELKGLVNQLRHMRFVGGKLSDTAKNELMVVRKNAAESIDKIAKKKIQPRHEVTTTERIKDSFLEFGYSHRRIGGIFETLDGFKEDGPMGAEYERITQASNKELELTDKMAVAMDAAFKDVAKQINKFKKETITKEDGVKFTLSHRARFTLALNWGNRGNRDAVLEGMNAKFADSYTEKDINKMLSTMSKAELEALNKVWAAKESMWPEMSKVEVNRKGVAPAKVEALPFEINGVKLTGGHYRLHYLRDPADSARSEITVDRAQSKAIKIGTASSMNERVGSGGRQVDLELGHLFQDLQEEIHYIAYAELSDHLNSIFKGVNNDIVTSIMKGYGEPYYSNLETTLSTLMQPEDPAKGLWKGLKFVRSNLTYGFLAGSIRNVVQQPIAITNSISQLGELTVLKGMFEFYRSPVKNWDQISKASAFMRNRTALVNREAREQLLKIDSIHPALGKMKTMAFFPQTFFDSLIAYPTWMGALSKYKKSHPNATEQKAILYADEMVAKTIGSGLSKDVGSILNKGEAEKQITFMGTFFNLTWNLHVENAQLLKNGDINPMEYARRLGWMAIAPALIAMWLLDDVPEDEEKKLPHALKEIGYYNMSSMFLLRDLASGMDGFSPSIPGLKFVDGIIRVGKESQKLMTGDEEFDANTVASILRGLQPLAPLPGSGQVARTLEGMADDNQGVWGSMVEGKERNK